MQPVYYDVAVSLDGFIAGPDADVSRFPHAGAVVDDYRARLQTYAVALMGSATYAFGVDHGLPLGANPYPHLRSVVFSSSAALPDGCEVEQVRGDAVAWVTAAKQAAAGPIYLCGGGTLAASLARAGLVDELRLKRAPIVLGGGTPLFGPQGAALQLEERETRDYGGGVLYQRFEVR